MFGRAYKPGDKFLVGEEGLLKETVLREDCIELKVEYEGNIH